MISENIKDVSFLNKKRDFLEKHGHTDSFLLLEHEIRKRYCFIGQKVEGYLGFGVSVNTAIILGGIICAPENRLTLVNEFLDYCHARFKRIIFFNIYEEDALLLKERGFEISYIGDDALLHLDAFSTKGTKKRNLRHTASIAKRFCTVYEVCTKKEILNVFPRLVEIDKEFLNKKATKEMGFFTGNLNHGNLEDKRLFVAESADRIEAYVFCYPMYPGKNYRPELFRKREDAYGVIELIMLYVIEQFRKEGVKLFTLGLSPAHRTSKESIEDYTWYRALMLSLTKYLNVFIEFLPGASGFNTLRTFKNKFRPDWAKCYVATYPKVNVMSTFACLKIWGFFRLRIIFIIKEFVKNFSLFVIKKIRS